jgi:hypothetical protein
MKKQIYLVLPVFIIIFLILYCERDNNNQNITGELIKHSECKSSKNSIKTFDIPDNQSCINYLYEKSTGKLSLKHINAGFNCCPQKLYCTVTSSGDTIIIKESENAPACNCDCLFDLDIEINGVTSGKYQVKFVEPYSGSQEKIIFVIDLDDHPEGSFCVTRKQYPWGMGS